MLSIYLSIYLSIRTALSSIRRCAENRCCGVLLLFLYTFLGGGLVYAAPNKIEKVSLSATEKELYRLLMDYRAEKGLASIPLSPSLTYVAQTHVRDLTAHPPAADCNLHSWSEYGDWMPCCYTPDLAEAKNMWNKPRELTQYKGAGYEIAFRNSAGATAMSAINAWKNSYGHNATMINQDSWSGITWRAIGIGVYGEYAVIWFGEEQETVDTQSQSGQTKEKVILTPPISMSAASSSRSVKNTIQETSAPAEKRIEPQNITKPVQMSVKDESSVSSRSKQKELSVNGKQKVTSTQTPTQAIQTDKQTAINKQKTIQYKPIVSRWPKAYYAYSGKCFMSVISVAYSYSFINDSHSVEASIFDFRVGLFGMTILGAEMSVYPYHLSVAYRPTISLYLPAAKCYAFVPYVSANVDATYLGTYFKKDFVYNTDTDFYAGIIVGLGMEISGVPALPMRIQVEYRHPLVLAQWQTDMRPGINVGVKFYIGKAFGTR